MKFEAINDNKYFMGIAMLLLNIGSKYIVMDISDSQEAFLKNTIMRRLTIFSLFYVATRDVLVAILLTTTFIVFTTGIWDRKKMSIHDNQS
jgi:hypothetical protein